MMLSCLDKRNPNRNRIVCKFRHQEWIEAVILIIKRGIENHKFMQNVCEKYRTTVDPRSLYFSLQTEGRFASICFFNCHFGPAPTFHYYFLSKKRKGGEKDVCVQTELFVYSTFEVYSILLYSCFKVY